MSTKRQEMQRIMRRYRDETGNAEVIMRDVAKYAAQRGWPLPPPVDPLDVLAKQFSQAAREEIRHDKKTGRPYRANHAISTKQGDEQLTLWIDIDAPTTTRKRMLISAGQRREQMVGDAVQLTFDLDHWNESHPAEEPIKIQLDFGPDVEWRKNGPEEKAG